MPYTLQEIAEACRSTPNTIRRHLKKKEFKKTCLGYGFNDNDVQELAKLFGFNIDKLINKK